MKLTKIMRERMVTLIVESKYPHEMFTKMKNEIGLTVMKIYTPKKGWEEYDEYIPVDEGTWIRTVSHGLVRGIHIPIPRRMRRSDYIPVEDLGKHGQTLVNTYEKILDQKRLFGTDVSAVLNSVNTSKQLIELAPELEVYLPSTTVASGLPVALETLNRVRNSIK